MHLFSRIRTIILLLIAVLPGKAVRSQQFDITFYNYRQGLYSPDVRKVFQDSKGYLWLFTNEEVYRFDGQYFEPVKSSGGKSIAGVEYIAEDCDHHVWIIENGILYLFLQDKFEALRLSSFKDNNNIDWVWFDNSCNMLFHVDNSLYRLNAAEVPSVLSSLTLDPRKALKLAEHEASIQEMLQDNDGNLIWNMRNRLVRYKNGRAKTFYAIDTVYKPFIHLLINLGGDSLIVGANRMTVSDEIHLELLTAGKTIFIKPDNIDSMSYINGVCIWGDEILILEQSGILSLDRKTLKQNYFYNINRTNDIKMTRSFTIGANGEIWLGTNEGLLRLEKKKNLPPILRTQGINDNPLLENGAFAVHYSHKYNKLLYGVSGGRIAAMNEQGVLEPWLTLKGGKRLRAGEITNIYEDSKGILWFISFWSGIWRYHNGIVTRFWEDNNSIIPGQGILSIFEDKSGHLWLGENTAVGEIPLNEVTDTTSSLKKLQDFHKVSKKYAAIRAINQDDRGNIIVGSKEGLIVLEGNSYKNLDTTIAVTDMIFTGKDSLWIATNNSGVLCYLKDKKNNTGYHRILQLTTSDGLINNNVLDLEKDANGNLWAACYNGLSVIRYYNGEYIFRNLSDQDGFFPKSFATIRLYCDNKNQIRGVTSQGIFTVNPDDVAPVPNNYPTSIMNVMVNNKPIDYESIMAGEMDRSLPYLSNNLDFFFRAISLSDNANIKFRCRLETGDTSIQLITDQRYVRYSSLAPGRYRFSVQSINQSGVPGKLVFFSFIIKPPWYNDPLYIIPLSLALLIIVFSAILYHLKKKNELFYKLKEQKILSESEKYKLELERNQLESDKHLLEYENYRNKERASRLVLNPHFLFNAFQSLQNLVSAKKTMLAETSIHDFAELMRKIIQYSESSFIRLHLEIDSIRRYVTIQQLRYPHIQYHIDTSKVEDYIDDLLIVNNIIQPFTENSIEHGLKTKKGEAILDIRFDMDEEHLYCMIEDNGIGRKLSGKGHDPDIHLSKAIPAIRERLKSMSIRMNKKFDLKIEDLANSDGSASGTRVTITMPADLTESDNTLV